MATEELDPHTRSRVLVEKVVKVIIGSSQWKDEPMTPRRQKMIDEAFAGLNDLQGQLGEGDGNEPKDHSETYWLIGALRAQVGVIDENFRRRKGILVNS